MFIHWWLLLNDMPYWGDVHDKTKWKIMPMKLKNATTLDATFEVDKNEIK